MSLSLTVGGKFLIRNVVGYETLEDIAHDLWALEKKWMANERAKEEKEGPKK